MKIFLFPITFVLSVSQCLGQTKLPEFIFTLYFQNALHETDSIEIGYDTEVSSNPGCDSSFGEKDFYSLLVTTPISGLKVVGHDKTNLCITDERIMARKTGCGKFNCGVNTCPGWFYVNVYNINQFPLKIWWSKRSEFRSDFCLEGSFIQTNLAGELENVWDWGFFKFKDFDTISVGADDVFWESIGGYGETVHSMYVQLKPGMVGLAPPGDGLMPLKYYYSSVTNQIHFHELKEVIRSVELFDPRGIQLVQKSVNIKGEFTLAIPVLSTGIYFMRVINIDGRSITRKILIGR